MTSRISTQRGKNTVLATFDGRKYIMDSTLDILSDELDPEKFFRISRSCILNMQAIESLVKPRPADSHRQPPPRLRNDRQPLPYRRLHEVA